MSNNTSGNYNISTTNLLNPSIYQLNQPESNNNLDISIPTHILTNNLDTNTSNIVSPIVSPIVSRGLTRSRRISNFNNNNTLLQTPGDDGNTLMNYDTDSDEFNYIENHPTILQERAYYTDLENLSEMSEEQRNENDNKKFISHIMKLSVNELDELKKTFLQNLKVSTNEFNIKNAYYINLIDHQINNLLLEEDTELFESSNSSNTYLNKKYLHNTCDIELLTKDNLDYLNKHCNDCQGLYGDYTNDDINELVTIKFLNSENKYKRGICFTKTEFKDYIKSSYNNDNPSNIQSIYTKPLNPQKLEDYISGITSKATGKIIIKIPNGFSPFITLGSADKILKNTQNKIWYALPLFDGKRRRIGGIQSQMIISGNHGQTPGYIIYKLYTKEEIKKNIKIEEKSSDYPLGLFLYDTIEELDFILGLSLNNNQIYKRFINGIIDYLTK